MNKDEIKSITVYYGGFFGGAEQRTITHDNEQLVIERKFWNGATKDGRVLYEGQTWNSLIEKLGVIEIDKWNEEYNNPDILDGTQWSLDIEYNDGRGRHYSGSNMYPENFNSFLIVMEMD